MTTTPKRGRSKHRIGKRSVCQYCGMWRIMRARKIWLVKYRLYVCGACGDKWGMP
jgi:DNA-directed RNA polymerase subunit RPC12/RpoP